MSETFVLSIAKEAIFAALKISAPILIVSMVIGLLVSIFQAVTQIQEQTLTFVPKLIAIVFVLLLLGSWMLETMKQFLQTSLEYITYIIR